MRAATLVHGVLFATYSAHSVMCTKTNEFEICTQAHGAHCNVKSGEYVVHQRRSMTSYTENSNRAS